MKKILTVSLGALLIATAANADIASVDYVTNGLKGKQDASTIGTVNSDNMGTTASTVVAAIKEVATEAAAAQTTADTAKTNAATAQSTADTAKANAATAQTTADTAKANAATAQTTANNALTKANAAVVANNAIQAGTGTKITYDSKGLVTGSTSLTASDIPTLSIGKVSGLQTALDGKQATLTTSNIKGSGSVTVGITDGVITVSGTDNNTTYSTGTASTSGLTKLYTGTGSSTDGTMTQSAITTALSGKQDKLTIDSELSKTSTNPLQNKVVTEELDRKQNASTAVEVATAGTAVGSATIPVYVNASGVATAITSYSGTAAKATADASGQTITTTYATKTELAGKQDKLTIDSALNTGSTNPVQNMVVAKALNEKQDASTAVEVTTAGTAVGSTTIPVYVNASGVATPITSYGGLAAKATADASGQTITTTYATKTELTTGLDGKLDESFGTGGASKAVITNASGVIVSGTIATGMITNGAVTTAKIADGTIATDDIADSAVTAAKIADGGVTSAEIANSTIVDADISSSAAIAQSKIYGLTAALADKQVAAPVGVSEDNFYVTNNDGAWVDMFTAMPRDPECAEEKCALTYKAGKYAWEVVRQ